MGCTSFKITLLFLLINVQLTQAQCPYDIFVDAYFDCGFGELFVEVQGGNPPYSVTVDGFEQVGNSPFYFPIYDEGTYGVEVTDNDGIYCQELFSVFDNGYIFYAEITGPSCITPNQSAVLEVFVDGGTPPYTFYWNTGEVTFDNESFLTITQPGEYQVLIETADGCAYNTSTFTVEYGGFTPEIEVIAGAICAEGDTLSSNCQKVCTNTVVTYEVTNANGTDIDWEVAGEEEVEVNGNQVTVTWGEAGFGELTASYGDGGGQPMPEPLQVYCGQMETVDLTGIAQGFVYIADGFPTYTYSINGISAQTFNDGLHFLSDLPVGTHTVHVGDGFGNIISCEFDIHPAGECFISAYPLMQSPTSPTACDGTAELVLFSSNTGPLYSESWFNVNGDVVDNTALCCGTYVVQSQDLDNQDCTTTFEVTLPCNTSNDCDGGQSSTCVEILENPQAFFTTNPPATNGVLNICKGQPIEFFNQSEAASTYIWEFGDFTNSVFENPTHTYINAGQYEVTLLSRNDCFCSDEMSLIVNVSDLEIPEIECTGTVCKGETVTYRTLAECGTYNWTIIGNATILEGGTPSDNFITVEWNEGPEGLIELSVVGCEPALCDAAAAVVIPIITDDVSVINGPDKVCPDEISNYKVTDFGGSEFTWAVDGGNILEGQGTNQITVEWVGSPAQNPHSVMINYENCFLNCSGSDQMDVNIRSEYYVAGPIVLCPKTTGEYDAIDAGFDIGKNVNWTLVNSSGMTVFTDGPSSSTTIDFDLPSGDYVLQTTPQNTSGSCNQSYEIRIELAELPPLPTAIDGATNICPNETYTYTANGLPAHEFHWIINNGGLISEDFGNQLNVTWGSNPPYELTLSQISKTGLQCESEPINLTVNPLPDFTINGNDQICQEETGSYTTSNFGAIDYHWSINPSDAGTIISGQNSSDVAIVWHSIGSHFLSVDICGTTETLSIKVFELPQPVAVHPDELCPNELGQVSTTEPFSSYQWKNEDGTVASTLATPSLSPGYYEVVVTDMNGCTGNDIFQIEGLPNPTVSISTPGILGLCPTGTITIYALENTGGYDYQWFHDGNPLGTNASTLDITETGLYYVSIIDENGCTATSNSLLFLECADLGGTCINGLCVVPNPPNPGCTPIGNLDFLATNTAECNVINFTNTSINHIPNTLLWNFRDPTSGNNTSTLENPIHAFSQPGFYHVLLTGKVEGTNGDQCDDFVEKVVTVPAAADFEAAPGCVGMPIEFTDNSSFLPEEITAITNWNWNFGDPASGAANTSTEQNPTHIFPDDATYTVTLTITTAEGCTATISKTVSVNLPPEISFDSPSMNCANASLAFNLNYPTSENIVSVVWDFNDPNSGDANTSTQETAYHAFATAGSYNVTATATNIYGCIETHSVPVLVEQNNLSGLINPFNPAPICLGGTIDLTASPGGASWLWSTNETTEMITVATEGVYSVTVTDEEGCTYSPPSTLVEILPVPIGAIQAVEYNEFDQPTQYFDDNYTICEGEEVYLLTQTSADYDLNWSTGDVDQEISFTDDKGNLLSAGNYNYTVTITNPATGCTVVAGPFEVIVHPTPNDVMISSSSGGALCDGTGTILTIDNPDPTLTYVWNTGAATNSIQALAAGEYFVRVINDFGCEGESNRIEIVNAPNINSVPSGCHFACVSDTICLPNIPNIAAYQWYQDGIAIPAPQGTVADLIITESGSYTLEMTDVFGCTTLADPVEMTLVSGFGNILGEVWFDVNENGVIDATDTLVSGMELVLIDNGVFLDSANTDGSGLYGFANQLSSNNYTVLLNGDLLPNGWSAYQMAQNAGLEGCDDETIVDFLLFNNCTTSNSELTLETCENTMIEYNGVMLSVGDEQDFTLESEAGCDSIVAVAVIGLPIDTADLLLETCEGTMVEYNGVMLSGGDIQDFNFQNMNGCDSTVTVSVIEMPNLSDSLLLETCEGIPIDYNGTMLFAGDMQDFNFQSVNDCDSIVTVMVMGLPIHAENVELATCEGTQVDYNGTLLSIGDEQDFNYQNIHGCDSLVSVSVIGLPVDNEALALETCEGSMVDYNGTMLSAGDVQDFTFQNIHGCDSTVTVSVSGVPILTEDLELSTCEGTAIDYNGSSLNVGDEVDFTFQSINGCDSIVSVLVVATPPDIENLELVACEGGTIDYNGATLSSGDQMSFTFENMDGCDSIVTVSVGSLPSQEEDIQLMVCEGETVIYEGFEFEAGDMQTFNLQNMQGCDSIINVVVEAFQSSASSVNFDVCKEETIVFENVILMGGDMQEFTLQNMHGCDSIVTVIVNEVPEILFNLTASEICENESNGILEITDVQGGMNLVMFSINGNDFQESPTFENLSGGQYIVTARDENGCLQEEMIEIPSIPPLEITTEDAIINCNATGTELAPVIANADANQLNWEWSDGSTTPTYFAQNEGVYAVSISNDCETITRSIEVNFAPEDRGDLFYLPNVFSPNGDQINDEIQVYFDKNVEVESFVWRIFDRWGNLLFETDNPTDKWNGIYKGKLMNPAVFVYYIDAKVVACGQERKSIFKKGDITIVW